MARQTQLLEMMAENMDRRPGRQQDDYQRKLEGFLKVRLPTFDGSDNDPMVAEDWLREIEKKLDLMTCTDEECVGIAAYQLTGAARAWWDTYCDAHEDPAAIRWDEFTKEFREYHVPRGAMEAKAEEFRNISQDRERVQEYATRFTRMMRYAPPECVNSEEQKMYYFRKGLSTRIKLALLGNSSHTLREMINKLIEIERDRIEADAHKVRKEQKRRGEGSSRGAPRKRREENPRPPRPRYVCGLYITVQ